MGSFGEKYFVCDRNHLLLPRDITKSVLLTDASGVARLFIMEEVKCRAKIETVCKGSQHLGSRNHFCKIP